MSIDGHFIYKGLATSQRSDVHLPFRELFEKTSPTRVLEIGTFHGGLTLLLRDILDQIGLYNTTIDTYDIYDYGFLSHHINDGKKINKYTESLFNNAYDALLDQEKIKKFIESNGTTIVLCDGGSKKNEFKLLSRFLKRGDIIMAHDYARNSEYFETNIRDKIWNWMEIQDSDIQESINSFGLVSYMKEQFENVAWVCAKKE
jgi:hypothetical protein